MRIQYFLKTACLITISFLPLGAFVSAAQAEADSAHQQLRAAAVNYVESQLRVADDTDLRVQAAPLDRRIIVPQCPSNLTFSASQESLRQTNITVKANCPDNNWYLYLMVKTQRIQEVIVANSAISPGALLTPSNIEIIEMDKNQIRGSTFRSIDELVGARLKRRIRPGQPITPNQLCFVCKGDSITISAELSGLSIKTTGIAQQDGNIGDTIWVKNSASDKLVHARVKTTQMVQVNI